MFPYGVSPAYKEAHPGKRVEFTCNSLEEQYIEWFFNDGPINDFAEKKNSSTIIIRFVKVEHTGLYTCYGLMKTDKKRKKFLATARLNVFGKFLVTIM